MRVERLPDPPPVFLVRWALAFFELVERVRRRLLPPELVLFDGALGIARTHALAAVARHHLADHLAEGPLTAEALAARAGLNADATYRLVRGLAAFGIFDVLPDGRLANNRISACVRADRRTSMRHALAYWGMPAQHVAWSNIDHWLRTGESALPWAAGRSVWAWYAEDDVQGENFAEMMHAISLQDAPALATAWPFAGRVCDVGGGRGALLAEILVRHPGVRGTLVDGARAVGLARDHFAACGVADRAETVVGSFFDAVPEGHDVYVLKNILHDWDDDASVKILQRVRDAAGDGATVLVFEERLERTDTTFTAAADLHMALACDGGRERSEADIARLFAAAGWTHAESRRTASTAWLFVGRPGTSR